MNISQSSDIYRQIISFEKYKHYANNGSGGPTGPMGEIGPTGNREYPGHLHLPDQPVQRETLVKLVRRERQA